MTTTRTRSKRRPRPTRPALKVESLEDRTAPANLAITDAYFLGANDERMDTPTTGTRSRFRVEFTQEGVPVGRQYAVTLSVYGLVTETFQFTSTSADAVDLKATTDTAYLIDPGPVPATVHLDVGDVIPETNPNDNDQTFTFTPTAFTAAEGKFIQPLPGTPLVNWYINNYVDLDPDPGKTEIQDYHGGSETYDTHDALDISIGGWDAMDLGVPVMAAASGVVVDRDDGHPDRNHIDLDSDENPPVNFVAIDHGNGWRTYYLHLRTNSVTVKKGDVVKPGDVIGLVGSSGRSTGPHLHFAVKHYDLTVETYMDPAAYWVAPAPYTEDNPDVFPADPKKYFITENSGAARVFINGPVPVTHLPFGMIAYTTFENAAESSVDYDHTAGTGIGFPTAQAVIPIIDDNALESQEDLLVKVEDLDFGIGDWLSVQIADNDLPIFYDEGTRDLSITTRPGLINDTVNLSVKDGYLDINTSSGDTLFPLDYGPVSSITINTGDGDDHVIVVFTGVSQFPDATLKVNAGGGFDDLTFTDSNFIELRGTRVSTVFSSLGYALTGIDRVLIEPLDVGPAVVEVDSTPAVPELIIDGSVGDWDDKIHVAAVFPGISVEIDPGGGNDLVEFGFAVGDLDWLGSQLPMLVHGGSGAGDALVFNDPANTHDNMYTLVPGGPNNAGFIRNSTLFVNYDGFEAFDLFAGSGDDHVVVRGTLPGIQINIRTGPGDDDIRVDSNGYSAGGTVNGVQGPMTIDAGLGAAVGIDTLTLNDESDGSGNPVTVKPGSVQGMFGPGGNLGYAGLRTLKIQLGAGADTINVEGTAAGTTTIIKGGRGLDTFHVGAPGEGLGDDRDYLADSVAGPLVLDGELGADTLTVDDTLDHDDTTATVTPNTIGAAAGDNLFGPGGKLSYASMTSVFLLTGAGRDTVDFWGADSLTAVKVSTGDNNDQVNVTPVGRNMEQARTLLVAGGAGRDALVVDDRNNPYSHPLLSNQYTVTPALVKRYFKLPSGPQAVPAAVGFSEIEDLTLDTGTKGDTVKIESGPARASVNTGDGKDTVVAGQAGMNLEKVSGLTVNGGADFDTLLLNDQNNPYADPLSRQYTLSDALVGRFAKPLGAPQPVFVSVGYDRIENLTVTAGNGADVIGVDGTSATTYLHAGGGDDVVKVGNGIATLDGLKGDLFVNGDGHVAGDSLVLNDQGAVGGKTFVVTGHTVARSGAGVITYNTTESLAINAGTGDDVFTVNSTLSSTPVQILAGPGDDAFSVNTPTGLDPIQGALAIDGQGNQPETLGDQLELKDTPKLAGQTYTINTTTVARAGMSLITYLGLERAGLTGGSGPDTFNVRGTNAPLGFAVDGQLGDDTYNVGSLANTLTAVGSLLVYDVAGGFDRLFVNDQGNNTPSNYVVSPALISGGNPAFVISHGVGGPLEKVVLNTGAASDTVRVTGTAAGTAVAVNGGGGTNTLDYTAYNSPVFVNLPLGQATDLAGGIQNIQNVVGGAGHDILVGNAGQNQLRGGGGRDILIGGPGADVLFGGDDDDLLFDGTTAYDLDSAALKDLQSVWASALPYADRVRQLRTGALKPAASTTDVAADQVSGEGGQDWFWADPALDQLDRDPASEALG